MNQHHLSNSSGHRGHRQACDAAEPYLKESSDTPLGLVLLAGEVAFPHAAPLLKFVELVASHFSAKDRRDRAQLFLDLLRDQQELLDVLGNNYDKMKVKVEDLSEAVQVAVFRDAEAFNDSKRDRYLKILGRLQGFGLAHEIDLSPREVPIGDYCFRPSKRA